MIPIFNNQPWVSEAVCPTVDPEIFQIDKGGSALPAKLVCAGCPVQAECFQWAIDTGERWGILGGYSYFERRKFKRGGKLKPLPDPVERIRKRCAWCTGWFTGEQMYCCTECSSSGNRAERLERLAEIRDAS